MAPGAVNNGILTIEAKWLYTTPEGRIFYMYNIVTYINEKENSGQSSVFPIFIDVFCTILTNPITNKVQITYECRKNV